MLRHFVSTRRGAAQRRPLPVLVSLTTGLLIGLTHLSAAPGTTAAAATEPFTVQTLHFKVEVDDRVCDIVGDLYVPDEATPSTPVPAILTTNGFGGSKDGQAGFGETFADLGYVVLSYSGLGFGGSDCKISLDHPEHDGRAGSQLISYLGGADGIAYLDDQHAEPAPTLDVVKRDTVAHDGHQHANDPRVGMVGGSYGGQVQFAIASVDARLDTIVPIYTWNDLSYALGPNNTDQVTGVSTRTPGALKLTWSLGFTALGLITGLENAVTDPSRLLPCPNFTTFVCPAVVSALTFGHFLPGDVDRLREASVASYVDKIRIPTLLMQGQQDSLFNLNEAAATYEALRAQGTEVKMIWQSWGHSNETPAPGEIDLDALDRNQQYQGGRVIDWFDHYLKDLPTDTGPEFAYFRDWVEYEGSAEPAYGTSPRFPVGTPYRFHLSGSSLTDNAGDIEAGKQGLVTAVGGLPTNLSKPEEVNYLAQLPVPELDPEISTATWTSDHLAHDLEVVGSPELTLKVEAPLAQLLQGPPSGVATTKLTLFARLQDVAPDGTATDIHQLTAPVRVPDVRKPFTVTMPAITHRFADGHRVRLVLTGSSLNYRGGLVPYTVTVRTGSPDQLLELPVVNLSD